MIPGINHNTVFFNSFSIPKMEAGLLRLFVSTQILQAVLDSWKTVRESLQKQAQDSKETHENLQERLKREKGIRNEIVHRKGKSGLIPQTAPAAMDGNTVFFYHHFKA